MFGGSSDDFLQGELGTDTYVFEQVHGQDVINNFSNNANDIDKALFGDEALNLIFSKQGNDMVISHDIRPVFRVTLYFTRKRKEDGTLHGFYRVVKIYAPEKYEGREEEFIQAIQEAILEDAKEWGCTSIEFTEMARPQYKSYDISQTGSYA